MKHVLFVAPYFLPATIRFIEAVTSLNGIRIGLVCCDPIDRLDPKLKARIHAWFHVGDCFDVGQLAIAARKLATELGGLDVIFGALEELQVPLGKLRDYMGVAGMSARTAHNFRDKGHMKNVLQAAGVPCARHRTVTDSPTAWAFAAEVGYPLVVKPPSGAGARATFKVSDDAQLRDYLAAYAPCTAEPALLEEFITGEEHSFESVCIGGKVIWHSLTRYYPSPLEVLKNPWIQWCVLLPREVDHPRFDDMRQVNQAALHALGMGTGLSHMEWFRRADGSIAISEVGARPPGAQFMTLMSYAHDKDFYKAWAELVVFGHFDPPKREYAAGACYLRGMGQGKVTAVHGLDQAQKEVGDIVMEARLPKVGQQRASSYEGEGYIIVRHRDTEVVKKALNRLVSLIRVEYS